MHPPTHHPARRPACTLATLAAPLVLAALAGCNTVKGIGQDIQAGAQKTQEWLSGDSASTRQSKAEPKN
jgi:predicted small secreted protein